MVTWINKDIDTHTATSDSALFDLSLIPNVPVSYTFTKAGTYSYHCSLHPEMTGVIVVK